MELTRIVIILPTEREYIPYQTLRKTFPREPPTRLSSIQPINCFPHLRLLTYTNDLLTSGITMKPSHAFSTDEPFLLSSKPQESVPSFPPRPKASHSCSVASPRSTTNIHPPVPHQEQQHVVSPPFSPFSSTTLVPSYYIIFSFLTHSFPPYPLLPFLPPGNFQPKIDLFRNHWFFGNHVFSFEGLAPTLLFDRISN